jgi:hypothetical protein
MRPISKSSRSVATWVTISTGTETLDASEPTDSVRWLEAVVDQAQTT